MPSILVLPRDAWRLARPYFNSEERWGARAKLAAVIALNLSLVGMDVVFSFWNRAFFNTLQEKDPEGFLQLLLTYRRTAEGFMPGFVAIAAIYILFSIYRTYLRQWLEVNWRRWMTVHTINNWLADRAYYRISLLSSAGTNDGTDNPDQRIAEDVRDFVSQTLYLSLDLLSNIVTLFSFITILWTLSGSIKILGITIPGYMVWVALIYSALGTFVTQAIGKPLVLLNFLKQRVEANFRFSLMRLRENTEAVALSRGETLERQSLTGQFDAVVHNWMAIMRRTKLLNAFTSTFDQIAGIFPIVVAAPRFFAGSLALGDLTQTADAFGRVQGSLSWFVASFSSSTSILTISAWRATIDRLNFFNNAIASARAEGRDGVSVATSTASHYQLTNATLQLPDGRVLLHTDQIVLQPARSVVFTGRSGTGKSTLFRAFAGIWPFGHGEVTCGHGSTMFLPQRPYFPLGTLRQAVTYPAEPGSIDDAAIIQTLTDVGLPTLTGQLDKQETWGSRLSGGEQQRLALARALLLKPDWLFLDEATASLDPETEQHMLAVLRDRLPDTAIISIAHRPEVAAAHETHYVIQTDGTSPAHIAPLPPA